MINDKTELCNNLKSYLWLFIVKSPKFILKVLKPRQYIVWSILSAEIVSVFKNSTENNAWGDLGGTFPAEVTDYILGNKAYCKTVRNVCISAYLSIRKMITPSYRY